jgi:hypothetical protein
VNGEARLEARKEAISSTLYPLDIVVVGLADVDQERWGGGFGETP